MDIGFETIGNATVICHDRVPVLVTDPWLIGSAYFGSWTISHDIPAEQIEAIQNCHFVWISHGHPDHLSPDSLKLLRAKTILLPDHRGNRIRDDLIALGYDVQVLENRVWNKISDRIRIISIADYNQDGILLIDINDRLIVNLNDAGDRGWGSFVRGIVKQYKISFLLKLAGFGDADMINLFNDSGVRIPLFGGKREPVGEAAAIETTQYGTKYFVPFSSMHRYQRSDSIWANDYTTEPSDYKIGFSSRSCELLSPFIRYDCERDSMNEINPPRRIIRVYKPEDFGDDWGEQLEATEKAEVSQYFLSIHHLQEHFDFLNFRVGGQDNVIELARKRFNKGITFEVPRNSLVTAVKYHVFDDLLIGNFMKTTLHGSFMMDSLYPDFTPYVAKYADNGKARTREELAQYFEAYRRQAPYDYFRHLIEATGRRVAVSMIEPDSAVYKALARSYHFVKSL